MGAMKTRRLIFALATLAGAQLGASSAASATTGLALMPSTILLASMNLPARCGSSGQPAFGSPFGAATSKDLVPASKSQAILGGQPSQLEMIARQQDPTAASTGLALGVPLAGASLTPGVGGGNCQQLALPTAAPFKYLPGLNQKPLASEDFLASKRLPVLKTAFDTQWQRVSHGHLSRKMVANLASSAIGGASQTTLAAVNSWTNAHVRYVEDSVQYGRNDYWAGAQATFRRGAGDCEDIAIAKMQMLAALGVPRSNLYLTIARDLVRHADHALLVVKMDGGYWLLDNASNQVLDASSSYDYRPILSYNESGTWLHGY